MKKLLLLLLLVTFVLPGMAQEIKTSTYYLIRHAEKDRSDKTDKNPHLSTIGKKRAKRWAEQFKHLKLDAIYSTDYNRTIETGKPTAKHKDLTIQNYHPTKLNMDEFLQETKGKHVLIIGHSNTTAQFANKLIQNEVYEGIADDNNSNLYIVVLGGDIVEHVMLQVE